MNPDKYFRNKINFAAVGFAAIATGVLILYLIEGIIFLYSKIKLDMIGF